MSKKHYILKFTFLAIAVKVIFVSYFYIQLQNIKTASDKNVIIPKNCSIKCVADILVKNKVIENKYIFEFYSRFFGLLGKKIIAGEYLILKSSNVSKIYDLITSGDVVKHYVTIPEGLTNSQIINILSNLYGITTRSQLNKEYGEGKLYPSTYEYLYNTNLSDLLAKMNKKMNKLLDEEWEKRDIENTKELKSKYDALILASIIEKEAKFDDEKPRIAIVYLNRLKKKMPLQADPTVIYGISGWDNFNRKVTYNDLKIQSPYNTYLNLGLPPTPICNPGKSSIVAALNPTQDKDLYFVADNSGRHLFSNSYLGHLKNIKKIRSN